MMIIGIVLSVIINNLITCDNIIYFRVGATFEIIRTELREICISIDHEPGVAAPFKWKRERQGSGETERESVCVCECRSTPG